MAGDGKGAVGAAGFGILALLAGMGRFADDCGRVAARGASHAASGVDDMARLGRYGDEAAGLGGAGRYGDELAGLGGAGRYGDEVGLAGPRGAGLVDDVDPWRPLNPEGVTRGGTGGARTAEAAREVGSLTRGIDELLDNHWLELGRTAVDVTLEFAPSDDNFSDSFSGTVVATAPTSLGDLRTRFDQAPEMLFVVTVEHEGEGRPAIALAIAEECRAAGRYCIVAVSSSGRYRDMISSAFVASMQGAEGLLGRLRTAAQNDGNTQLYRVAPGDGDIRLIEFSPR